MDLELVPRRLSGAVTPPPSKSMTHRLLLCAALAEGTSCLAPLFESEDIRATLACMQALGAPVENRDGRVRVTGVPGRAAGETPHFPCGESASTLRFFLPTALAVCGGGVFTGRGRLMERPLGPYLKLFDEKGVFWDWEGGALRVRGRLPAGDYRLPGGVSSQFFSGLLMALPLLDAPSRLTPTSPLESEPYLEMTLEAMAAAGVSVEKTEEGFLVRPQRFRPFEAEIEADWSQAAFWLVARFLGNDVRVCGLKADSRQGDRRIAAFLEQLSHPGDRTLDLSQTPDLLPPLAVMAALREGNCRLKGAARLRLKESDRLASVAALLRALGAELHEEEAALTIRGTTALRGGAAVDCCGDHRIAMAAAVAATRCEGGSLRLLGADCVKKSYPDFWEVYRALGGECHVL